MGHLGIGKNEVLKALARRLDKNPIGAPLNDTLMAILQIMFTEKEALVGSHFPAGFTTLDKLALLVGLSEEELQPLLNTMADKGLVIDIPRKNRTFYALSPLVIGFFEYTFMRVTDKLPLSDLAELFHKYHHEQGVAEEFFGGETKMFHTWAYESLIPSQVETEVLPYEKASEMIRDSGGGSLTMCYCRHQAWHRGTACDAPLQDVCMSMGAASEWLVRRGFSRPAGVDEMLRVLEQTEKLGLVHLADNVQKNPAYLCHCCGCCCGVLKTQNEHGLLSAHPSNFIPRVDQNACSGCGACVRRCHVKALDLAPASTDAEIKKARIKSDLCLGCGACVGSCKKSAILLTRREQLYTPPRDKREQMARIAQDRGKIMGET